MNSKISTRSTSLTSLATLYHTQFIAQNSCIVVTIVEFPLGINDASSVDVINAIIYYWLPLDDTLPTDGLTYLILGKTVSITLTTSLLNEFEKDYLDFQNLFSFTAIGITGEFVAYNSGPFTVTITGWTYHRVLDAQQAQNSIDWFLYDENEHKTQGRLFNVPSIWIRNIKADLEEVNPYVNALHLFHNEDAHITTALELTEASSNSDFAAILHAGNTVNVQPCSVLIWKNSKRQPTFMLIYSQHYEPLQYPILVPHGTLGWGLTN
ncbi:hypothetical protein M422DRAFT_250436 [Sphaerobolus stellatus SS14]|uniref:Unplaced genomic scaffold SPHSTscaffold_34, whole genome shotgun sequence n=1 Tax=Sphaerobolus stellatus (strain SS14) TaxID=990650 RepID=A0A0C9VTT1_SPHS4|nr:hypothetical protein M422DRAFT_250436 [Sphaerobolus stellatus SS14]